VILAIDAGNSRIKWGFNQGGEWLTTGAAEHDELDSLASAWALGSAPEKIVISNVAGARMQRDLSGVLATYRAQPLWITPERERCGVKNGYADPAKLGSDRWAALIAARQMQRGPVVVVNAGTALTVDALSQNGEFLGGLIVPGIKLMMRALTTGTAHAHAAQGEFVVFPVNTLDAIYSGAINAAVGSIVRIVAGLRTREGAVVTCIISGGAAPVLVPHLGANVLKVDHLVLQGLVALAESTE
jgi:type III pantothenate kinase